MGFCLWQTIIGERVTIWNNRIIKEENEKVTLKCKDVKDNYIVVQNVLYIKSLNL